MSAHHRPEEGLEAKAIASLIEELERQAAERPDELSVRHNGDRVSVEGDLDIDALVMVVVGAMAGGP